LKEYLLVLAHDAKEAGQAGHEFILAQNGDDAGVLHRLEEFLIVFVVVDADDSAIVKPWILLYLLQNSEAIDAGIREIENFHFGELVFQELYHFPPIGKENRDELAFGTGTLQSDDLIEPRIARDNWDFSHGYLYIGFGRFRFMIDFFLSLCLD
jgi:hypothetical protein